MRGIYINGKHTGDDMGMVMTEKDYGTPTAQTFKVNVPGRNGELDLSEFLTGEVHYNNREMKFKFLADGNRENIKTAISKMLLFHGQSAEIISDDYPDSYYKGRISIVPHDYGSYAEFEMSVDAEPFRTAREKSIYSFNTYHKYIWGKECVIVNNGMPVTATVTATKGSLELELLRGSLVPFVSEGNSYKFKLEHGTNIIKCSGWNTDSIATFEFTEVFL